MTPSTPSDFVPVVKNNVTYIVMAVLFNEDGEVLMMQEAKSSCAGQWYLPAGRMEPGEDIEVDPIFYSNLVNKLRLTRNLNLSYQFILSYIQKLKMKMNSFH